MWIHAYSTDWVWVFVGSKGVKRSQWVRSFNVEFLIGKLNDFGGFLFERRVVNNFNKPILSPSKEKLSPLIYLNWMVNSLINKTVVVFHDISFGVFNYINLKFFFHLIFHWVCSSSLLAQRMAVLWLWLFHIDFS
jgi:hypothetical protein